MEEMNRKADAVFMTETLFDGQTEQGVELDHVLPDYYPEIFRILKCCLSPRVISAAVSGNKIMLDGVVLIKVLYLAENSTALHCVEQRYTWSKTVDIAGKAENLCGEPRITVVPRTDYCNCRAVSSRRLDIRGAISCRITVTCPAKFTLPALPDGMQVLTREVSCCTEPIYADKQLAVREDIETGAPGIDYIISCDAVPRIDDLRVIANKAVVKGTVSISALYGVHTDEHSGCDELEKMSADIPGQPDTGYAGAFRPALLHAGIHRQELRACSQIRQRRNFLRTQDGMPVQRRPDLHRGDSLRRLLDGIRNRAYHCLA